MSKGPTGREDILRGFFKAASVTEVLRQGPFAQVLETHFTRVFWEFPVQWTNVNTRKL